MDKGTAECKVMLVPALTPFPGDEGTLKQTCCLYLKHSHLRVCTTQQEDTQYGAMLKPHR